MNERANDGMVVIGSGPTGVAATKALCDAGRRVTVLDAGDRIEAGKMDAFRSLAQREPEQWPPKLAGEVRDVFPVDVGRVPLKPAYGSLFPYALEDPDLPLVNEDADALASLAYGGLSNAWGAAIAPFRQQDIEDWPISVEELAPHYEAVLRFVPIAAERDDLAGPLPIHADTPGRLWRGPQADLLLRHMSRHADRLRDAGLSYGASRLAVVTDAGRPDRCRYCGLCLYGCPYRSIYSSAHTLDELVRAGRVDYRGELFVDRLAQTGGSVEVDFHERRRPGARGRLTASRVFVACGAISSTRLVHESAGCVNGARRLQDSQYFAIPMLTLRAAPTRVATQGNTLAQVFLELAARVVSRQAVHLQVYGYNDVMLAALAKRIRLQRDAVERLLGPLVGRLLLIQGFLHSADSPGLTLNLEDRRVRVAGDDTEGSARCVRRLVRHLAAHGRALGMVPIPGLVHVGRPGKSNHIGGSMPMRAEPGELETDRLGSPCGWSRVHVVDASVFPSLPATTVTISAMANAHRIATAAAVG